MKLKLEGNFYEPGRIGVSPYGEWICQRNQNEIEEKYHQFMKKRKRIVMPIRTPSLDTKSRTRQ